MAPMFQPFKLREMEVANRAVVSPMCMYSAKEGVPGDFHLVHYGSRAIGGAGLDLHRDDLRRPRRPHHAGLRWPVERRAGRPRGRASSISFTPTRPRKSACSSAMPAARAPPN